MKDQLTVDYVLLGLLCVHEQIRVEVSNNIRQLMIVWSRAIIIVQFSDAIEG